jgi:hypothetical protein
MSRSFRKPGIAGHTFYATHHRAQGFELQLYDLAAHIRARKKNRIARNYDDPGSTRPHSISTLTAGACHFLINASAFVERLVDVAADRRGECHTAYIDDMRPAARRSRSAAIEWLARFPDAPASNAG